MREIILLRFDAPLMSFGAPIVDNYNVVQPFPALSMLVGLLGNALGFEHGEAKKLQRLQDRLHYAARCDRPGEALRDYQTVDLGQPHLSDELAWTTWAKLDERAGASSKETHIRYRDYRADSIFTIALFLDPADEKPDIDELERALREPARPLFLGRKCCLPSTTIFIGRMRCSSPLEALKLVPRLERKRACASADEDLPAWWADEDEADAPDERRSRLLPVTDERDWRNQVHCGRRLLRQGAINPPEVTHGGT